MAKTPSFLQTCRHHNTNRCLLANQFPRAFSLVRPAQNTRLGVVGTLAVVAKSWAK